MWGAPTGAGAAAGIKAKHPTQDLSRDTNPVLPPPGRAPCSCRSTVDLFTNLISKRILTSIRLLTAMGFSPSVVKLDVNFEFSSQLSKLSTGDATGPVTCVCFVPLFLEGSVSE